MSYYFSGDPDRLYLTIGTLVEPLTISAWFYIDVGNLDTVRPIAHVRNSTGLLNYYMLEIDGGTAGDPMKAVERVSLSTNRWDLINSPPTSQWVNLVGRFDTNYREIFLNGVSSGSPDTGTMSNPDNPTVVEIGKRNVYLGSNAWYIGYIAEVAFWERMLDTDEIDKIGKGKSPDFFPSGLRFHAELKEDLFEKISENFLGKAGSPSPSPQQHPEITYPGSSISTGRISISL